MTSAADRLAQAHQREMATLAGGSISVVSSAALGADPMAVSTWFFGVVDSLISRIQADYAIASHSGQRFLRRHAALSGHAGVRVVPGRLNTAALRARLHITGPVAFKTAIAAGHDTDYATRSMASQMSGVAGETVLDGDRDVVHQTALHGDGVVGWRRVLIGRSCGFCSMLASRGAVYVSKESATVAKDGMAYHPHCNCTALPLYKHESEPASVRQLQRQWGRITAGHHGDDARKVWARYWDKLEPGPSQSIAANPATQVRDALTQAQIPEPQPEIDRLRTLAARNRERLRELRDRSRAGRRPTAPGAPST